MCLNFNKQINVHKEGRQRIERLLKLFKENKMVEDNAIIFDNLITSKVDVKKATGNYLPICIDNPRSNSTMEFKNLCHEIIDRVS